MQIIKQSEVTVKLFERDSKFGKNYMFKTEGLCVDGAVASVGAMFPEENCSGLQVLSATIIAGKLTVIGEVYVN